MTVETAAVLKTYFQTGDKPTEQQYVNLIDSIYRDNFTDVTASGTVSAPTVSATSLLYAGKATAADTTPGAFFSATTNNICTPAGSWFIINRPDAGFSTDYRYGGTTKGNVSIDSSKVTFNGHNTAKAWCVLTYSAGTPVATTSYNVSSITDTTTGDGFVNFSTALSTANFIGIGTNNTIVTRNVYVERTSISSSRYVIETNSDDNISLVWFAPN